MSSTFGSIQGAIANISSTTIPTEGIYSIVVSAPPDLTATGNYVLTATDTTPNPRDTAITIQSDRSAGMTYGHSVTFTATVKPLSATGPNANGTVQFSVDGKVVGSPIPLVDERASITLPMLAAGNRRVTVAYSGDGRQYDPKVSSEFTQIVNRATLRVAADSKSKIAGETIPALTYQLTGFVPSETADVLRGTPNLTVASEAATRSGTYVIVASAGSLASDNYAFQFSNGTLLVAPASPAELRIVSGANQSTKAGREFVAPLRVRLQDAFGNPIGERPVTFTAPESGPSGLFANGNHTLSISTNSNGEATIGSFTANLIPGSFSVFATFENLTARFQLTNNEQGAPLELSLSKNSISEKGGTATGTLRRNTPLGQPMIVSLTTSDFQKAAVPREVTIGANADVVDFTLLAIDNETADGDQLITVLATSAAATASTTVVVEDDEKAELNLLFSPISISEKGGVSTGTISRNTPTTGELSINLASLGNRSIVFPQSVTIPTGSKFATFEAKAIDDEVASGHRVVDITASAIGLASVTRQLEIADDERPELRFQVQATAIENDGRITALLKRNTTTAGALTVALATDLAGKIDVPQFVTIPDGSDVASFQIGIRNDSIASGDIFVSLSGKADGFVDAKSTIGIIDDETPKLLLSAFKSVLREDEGALQFELSRNTPTTESLAVRIQSSLPSQLEVPEFAIIPAGSVSTTFSSRVIDDQLLDGLQLVRVHASSPNFAAAIQEIEIRDHETVLLTLTHLTVSEFVGSTTATVTRSNSDTNLPVTVSVDVDDRNTIRAPISVTIPTNANSAQFVIHSIDDLILNGTRTVRVAVAAEGYEGSQSVLQVLDFEPLSLTTSVDSISEQGGEVMATILRSVADVSMPLVVELSVDDSSELTIPSRVEIPAGQSSVTFGISARDDAVLDGSQFVEVKAIATGYVDGKSVVVVTDYEHLALSIEEQAIDERGGRTLATLTRSDIDSLAELTATLSTNDGTELKIPTVVKFLAGQRSVRFPIDAIDDFEFDGPSKF